MQVDEFLATGQVTVSFDTRGEPVFDIVSPAAWDAIDSLEALTLVGDRDFMLVFGTLAQRDQRSRRSILELQEKASYCFYDVNLRPPYTTQELVLDSLTRADMVKVNENELRVLSGWCGSVDADKKKNAQTLIERFNFDALVVTEGAGGAWIIVDESYYQVDSEPIKVVDTVGAGDAFFASLIHGNIKKTPWDSCLVEANRRGGYVASQTGATPKMP